jgi:hypothetical protein
VEVVANEMMMLSERNDRREHNNQGQPTDLPPDEIATNEDEFPF